MKTTKLIQSMLAVSLVTACAVAAADPPAAPAADQGAVVVHGATPLQRVAPAWQSGRLYKFGELANYDGWAFKAKSGSAHIRPDVSGEVGWEKLNTCDDKSKDAVQCEVGNQAATPDAEKNAQREYDRVKQDMSKGKPTGSPEG